MARWEPDAPGRLAQAAMELYLERGYERTTVAEIAARAGLTERTFFRHFADKREVLFDATNLLERTMEEALEAAPATSSPLDAAMAAAEAATVVLEGRAEHARRRQAVVEANPELQEREFIKMASMVAMLTRGLRARGVDHVAAELAAEAAITIFRTSFVRWVADGNTQTYQELLRDSLATLRRVTSVDGSNA